MSAGPGSHFLRVRIARALAAMLADHSHTAIADMVGCAQTTITRRGEDLHQWPADDLLRLAVEDADLGRAVVTYLRGDDSPAGQPVRAVRELFQSLSLAGRWSALVSDALSDGKIDVAEALQMLAALRDRRSHMDQLERDLLAIAGDRS